MPMGTSVGSPVDIICLGNYKMLSILQEKSHSNPTVVYGNKATMLHASLIIYEKERLPGIYKPTNTGLT